MLPITHYNKAESLELYRSNAEYGVGILEFIVASGTKQKHITPKAELETYLKLEEILQPLQSSHTQSGKDTSTDSAPGTTEPTADKPKEETKTPAVNDKAK